MANAQGSTLAASSSYAKTMPSLVRSEDIDDLDDIRSILSRIAASSNPCPLDLQKIPEDLTTEEVWPNMGARERDDAINAEWVEDDDMLMHLIDEETGQPLYTRHPRVNEDRGDEVDLENLANQMAKDRWVQGVSGQLMVVANTSSKLLGAKWVIAGATRCDAFIMAWRRNPQDKLLKRTISTGIKHCLSYKKHTPDFILRGQKAHNNNYHTGVKRKVLEIINDQRRATDAWTRFCKTNSITQSGCGKGVYSWRGRWSSFNDQKFKGLFPSFNFFEGVMTTTNTLTERQILDTFTQTLKKQAYFGHPSLSSIPAMRNIIYVVNKLQKHADNTASQFPDRDEAVYNSLIVEAAACCVPRMLPRSTAPEAMETTMKMSDYGDADDSGIQPCYWPLQGSATSVGMLVDLLLMDMSGAKVCRQKIPKKNKDGEQDAPAVATDVAAQTKEPSPNDSKNASSIAFIDHYERSISKVLENAPNDKKDYNIVTQQSTRTVRFVITKEVDLSRGKKRKAAPEHEDPETEKRATAPETVQADAVMTESPSPPPAKKSKSHNDIGWSAVQKDVVSEIFNAHRHFMQRRRAAPQKQPTLAASFNKTGDTVPATPAALKLRDMLNSAKASGSVQLEEKDRLAISNFVTANNSCMPVHLQPFFSSLLQELSTNIYAMRSERDADLSVLEIFLAMADSIWKVIEPQWIAFAWMANSDVVDGSVLPDSCDSLFEKLPELVEFQQRRAKLVLKLASELVCGEDRACADDYGMVLWYVSDKVAEFTKYDIVFTAKNDWAMWWSQVFAYSLSHALTSNLKTPQLAEDAAAAAFLGKEAPEVSDHTAAEEEVPVGDAVVQVSTVVPKEATESPVDKLKQFALCSIVESWAFAPETGVKNEGASMANTDEGGVAAAEGVEEEVKKPGDALCLIEASADLSPINLKWVTEEVSALLWKHALVTSGGDNLSNIFVDLAEDKELIIKATKLTRSNRLHLMGRLTLMPNINGIEVGAIGSQKFFLDGSQDRALTCDYLFPGWLLPILPATQASLELKYNDVVLELPTTALRGVSKMNNKIAKFKFSIPYLTVKANMIGQQNVALTRPATAAEHEAGFEKVRRASVAKTKALIEKLVVRGLISRELADAAFPPATPIDADMAGEKLMKKGRADKSLSARGKHLLK